MRPSNVEALVSIYVGWAGPGWDRTQHLLACARARTGCGPGQPRLQHLPESTGLVQGAGRKEGGKKRGVMPGWVAAHASMHKIWCWERAWQGNFGN